MIYFVIFLSAFVAGIVNSLTGFGSGIIMMLFFPYYFPMLQATAISASVSLVLNGSTAWKYRDISHKNLIILPAVFYIICSSLVIAFSGYFPKTIILRIFGIFLILLSSYFLFFSKKISIKASTKTAILCSTISGMAGGLFGIGGPPMVIYFLACLDDKREYLATIQTFFFITGLYNFIFRIINGIYTLYMLPFTAIGLIAIIFGKSIGGRLVNQIDSETMKKIIYIFLGFCGLLNLFK